MIVDVIYNEDMRSGMSRIPDESVDCIITDPPYRTTKRGRPGSGVKKNVGGMLQGDGQFFDLQFEISISEWFPMLYRCLKPGSHCYVFTNLLNMHEMLNIAKQCGFLLQNVLVWEKNNCTPSQYYMKNCEYVLLLRKGRARWINKQGSKTVHKFNNVPKKVHPCEKPIELLQFYIENSTEQGDVVLDPFMGSGATAIAALRTNRHYIGFELDTRYHGICEEKITNEANERRSGIYDRGETKAGGGDRKGTPETVFTAHERS